MEIDKIKAGQYTSYKVKNSDETKKSEETEEQNAAQQQMTNTANQLYADVTAVSTDEDATVILDESNAADKDGYQAAKNYVNSYNGTSESAETEETEKAAPVEDETSAETDEAASKNSNNAAFADKDEVSQEVESLIKDIKTQLKAKGATDAELSKLDYLSAHFDAETFLNDNPDATLNDLETEITKEAEKLTDKSL